MEVVRGIWDALEHQGVAASIERLIASSHADVEIRPYAADGRTLHGHAEVREFYRENTANGASIHALPWRFEERGDTVYVSGTMRIQRRDGSLADASIRWRFLFRGDRIAEAESAPLTADVPTH
jgi:hypothetical protein